MSYGVERWVWSECTVEDDLQRYVLLAIAWHCKRDDGTGAECSIDTLATMVRRNRKSVLQAIERLEEADELVVWRTDVRVRGRRPSNRYAVVMGRAPDDVRQLEVERCRPAASTPGAVQATAGAVQRATAPPAGAAQRTLSTGPTPSRPRRSRDSPGTVQGQSRSTLSGGPDLDLDTERSFAALASRGAGRRAGPVSEVDERLAELRRLVEAGGLHVAWDFSPDQAAVIAAQVVTCGAQALADEALALATTHRTPPRSARAWLTAWEILPPHREDDVGPSPMSAPPPCGSCDRHLGGAGMRTDDDSGRVWPCPTCHPSAWTSSPF